MRALNFWWIPFSILGLGWGQEAAAQLCGSATGMTPYTLNSACVPRLTFKVSGQCLSACGAVTEEFTSPDVTAFGACTMLGPYCAPTFVEQNKFNSLLREFYSTSAHRKNDCTPGSEVLASSGPCPCEGCSGGTGPGNNTTPGEDPLLISISDTEYRLTSYAAGVKFDLNGDGEKEKTAWTAAGADDAFLVLDRSGELQSLEGVVSAIHLDYQRSLSRDEFGNELRYWANLERPFGSEGAIVAWNVFFAAKGPTTKQ